MSKSISDFIHKTLFELADEYQIPKPFIPLLTALIEKYPNMEIRGKKKELREDLEKMIANLKDQGLLNKNAL